MDPTASIGENISEFHHGSTYQRTKKKFGKKKADKQAVAVAYATKRRRFKRKSSGNPANSPKMWS